MSTPPQPRPAPKPAPPTHTSAVPWVRLKSAASGPLLYKRMLGDVDPKARPGDIVAVYDKSDAPYGMAIYNPKSLLALRLLHRGRADMDLDEFFGERLKKAIDLRRGLLKLDAVSDAYRLVHDQGDGFPGLVIDRYGDHLVLEFYSLGMFRQADRLERLLALEFPGAKFTRRASQHTETMEGFRIKPGLRSVSRVQENGVQFEVVPSGGYKTGFFCDQRDNRLAFSKFAQGKRVLDVCCYTGGFGIYAKKLGGAEDVICVELDPEAAETAKRNANINQVKVSVVTVDAFPYLRQAAVNKQTWGLVILDPYKFIGSKDGYQLGKTKYIDLNKLGMSVVEPGGILVTCSCSGMVSMEEFQQFVRTAAGSTGRRIQILRKSGAGPDHPFVVDYPEGEYLKVLWCRVL